LSVNRVTKVTKGVELGFSAIVVVGDENGVVGHGLGNLKMFLRQSRRRWKMLEKLVKFLEWQSVPHEQKGNLVGVYSNSRTWYRSYCWWSCSFSLESVGFTMYYLKDHQISQRCQSNFDALLQMRSAYSVAKQRGVSLEKF
jgi:small subunit ribosomal protein S5